MLTLHIGWPQAAVLAWLFLVLVSNALKNGEPRRGYHSGWTSGLVIASYLTLLYMGGFFGQ